MPIKGVFAHLSELKHHHVCNKNKSRTNICGNVASSNIKLGTCLGQLQEKFMLTDHKHQPLKVYLSPMPGPNFPFDTPVEGVFQGYPTIIYNVTIPPCRWQLSQSRNFGLPDRTQPSTIDICCYNGP